MAKRHCDTKDLADKIENVAINVSNYEMEIHKCKIHKQKWACDELNSRAKLIDNAFSSLKVNLALCFGD